MKWLWRYGLALSLGLLVTAARAEPTVWRPIASAGATPSQPAAQIQKPIAQTGGQARQPAPVVSLGKPVPIASSGLSHQALPDEVQPVSLRTPVVRGSSPEPIYQPMPGGSVIDPPGQLHGWRRANEPLSGPTPTMNTPGLPAGVVVRTGSPLPEGPIATNTPPMGAPMPPGSAPLYNPACPDCGGGAVVSGSPMGGFNEGHCLDGHCGNGCPPGHRWWFGVDYLAWKTKGDPTPALVNTGSLANPSTIFGGNDLGDGVTSGLRGTVGYWFGDDHCLGLEFGGFYLGNNSDRFGASSVLSPTLVRPGINALMPSAVLPEFVSVMAGNNLGQSLLVAGGVTVDRDQNLWGGEANFRRNWLCGCNGYLDALIGFRMLGLDENLAIQEDLMVLRDDSGRNASMTRFNVRDQFSTSNRFYGGQVGLEGEYRLGSWIFGARGKVGLGSTEQIVQINGSTTRTLPGQGPMTMPGGFLTQASTNIGRYTREEFSVVPELGLTLGYQCTDHLRLTLGYTFLYWSSVVRPGQQIDNQVNPTRIPFYSPRGMDPAPNTGPARPAFNFNGSDFWAQGLTFGLEFRY